MGNNKIRLLGLVVALFMIGMAVFPGAVQADLVHPASCHFTGEVVMSDGSPILSEIEIRAEVIGASSGPWTVVPVVDLGRCIYNLFVEGDDYLTPEKEGGVEGDIVKFSVYIGGKQVVITNNTATFIQAGNISKTFIIDGPIVLLGDANADGFVNIGDVLLIELYMAGQEVELSPGADANQDGKINIADILTIELIMAGLIP